jgi:hypothetical protein
MGPILAKKKRRGNNQAHADYWPNPTGSLPTNQKSTIAEKTGRSEGADAVRDEQLASAS